MGVLLIARRLGWGLFIVLLLPVAEVAKATQLLQQAESQPLHRQPIDYINSSSSDIYEEKDHVSQNVTSDEAGWQDFCRSPKVATYSASQVQTFEAARLDQVGNQFYNQASYLQALEQFEHALAI